VRVLSLRLEQHQNRTIRDLQEKNLQLTQAYEQLKAAQAHLIEKEKMERELEVARGIQQSMVPRKLPHLPGFDFGARMMPARAVGGDFFDFIPLSESTLGIVIGDVSDKGVPAALFMALTPTCSARKPGARVRSATLCAMSTSSCSKSMTRECS
jgi:Serine phosphatase RsbU, regulator of sigma subunit